MSVHGDPRASMTDMQDFDFAELLAAHIVLGSHMARVWRLVVDGLSPEVARGMLREASPEHVEHARRVFAPLSPEQRRDRFESLLVRLGSPR